jgi:pimeloyl-ACP methyl ester carboxylesterase
MTPFFFGTSGRRLFGVYEPAGASTSGQRAAILCYPWGAEYLYAHRTLRQLALKLSRVGFHTLRFDYYGTGDSGGEPTDTDLTGCEADLETGIAELMEITGLAKVTVIGLRLGGAVAARVALRLSSVIEALVLWDPIVFGPEYLNSLGVPSNTTSLLQAQGFPLTERMLGQLGELDLRELTLKLQPRTLFLVTEQLSSLGTLVPSRRQKPGALSMEFLQDVRPWLESSVVSGMVPFAVLRRILSRLE